MICVNGFSGVSVMRYGIPLLGNRIAPRCIYADSVLLVVLKRNRVSTENNIAFSSHSLFNLIELLSDYRVDTLICCGISRESREFLESRNVNIIDNVSSTVEEILEALKKGAIYPGFGLSETNRAVSIRAEDGGNAGLSYKVEGLKSGEIPHEELQVDCISCRDRVCLRGGECSLSSEIPPNLPLQVKEIDRMLEASLDISSEEERKLCRLSELIYYCLEMKYKRIGVAFCTDLQEPAEILTQVMRRFFDVFPVCCKIGGLNVDDSLLLNNAESSERGERKKSIACNPLGQARVLNRIGTDFNVLVGICIGADSIFTQASDAPVTTLFVKDKSLANNPIGALYSDYYLKEASMAEAS
jgi:uncharacterized metal-binding protein/predicted Fe-Mo cluster-binding NifX family protein